MRAYRDQLKGAWLIKCGLGPSELICHVPFVRVKGNMGEKTILFSTEGARRTLNTFLRSLEEARPLSEFEMTRNKYIELVIGAMVSRSDEWDDFCQVNIQWIGSGFLSSLSEQSPKSDKARLDDIFSTCFRFLLELYLSTKNELSHEFERAKRFAFENIRDFDDSARQQIEFAAHDMPISIFKAIANSEEIGALKEFSSTAESAIKLRKEWDEDLSARETRVANLRDDLAKYESAFNFVGLYQGFDELAKEKVAEKKSITFWLRVLGVVVVVPILIEMLIGYFRSPSNVESILFVALPTISFVAIAIYYFRVLLYNYRSVKTQLLQIELRKTLCRFIQHYADYSAKIKDKDKESLSRFEEIIFSGIVSDEERLPSAYDGLEQLAQFIRSVK